MTNQSNKRAWLWFAAILMLGAMLGILWLVRRLPSGTIDVEVVARLQTQLQNSGFVLTNNFRTRSEVVIASIPVGRFLGLATDEIHLPFSKDGGALSINYKFRGDRAFEFMLPADSIHAELARSIASELTNINPAAVVRVWTTDPTTAQP